MPGMYASVSLFQRVYWHEIENPCITLFRRTRKQVQVSPMKEELQDGNLVITQQSIASDEGNTTHSSSDNRKKDGKGYRKLKK